MEKLLRPSLVNPAPFEASPLLPKSNWIGWAYAFDNKPTPQIKLLMANLFGQRIRTMLAFSLVVVLIGRFVCILIPSLSIS